MISIIRFTKWIVGHYMKEDEVVGTHESARLGREDF
jgi:hypothetical protein